MWVWVSLVLGLSAPIARADGATSTPVAPSAAPTSDVALLERARMAVGREDYADAIPLYERYLNGRAPTDPARHELAMALAWWGKSGEAVQELDHYLAANPADADARLGRGEILSWGGNYARALSDFRQVLGADPKNPRALLGTARVYRWSGRKREAYSAYRRALAIEPDNEEAATAVGELGAAFRPAFVPWLDHQEDSDGYASTGAGLEFHEPVIGVWDAALRIGHFTVEDRLHAHDPAEGELVELRLGRALADWLSTRWDAGADLPLGSSAWGRLRAELTFSPRAPLTMCMAYARREGSSTLLRVPQADRPLWLDQFLASIYARPYFTGEAFLLVQHGILSDDNRTTSLSASFSQHVPILSGLRVEIGSFARRFTNHSSDYYSPDHEDDLIALLALDRGGAEGPWEGGARIGSGRARTEGTSATVLRAAVHGTWRPRAGLGVTAEYNYSESVHTTRYIMRDLRVTVRLGI